jgi:hypothetical protein
LYQDFLDTKRCGFRAPGNVEPFAIQLDKLSERLNEFDYPSHHGYRQILSLAQTLSQFLWFETRRFPAKTSADETIHQANVPCGADLGLHPRGETLIDGSGRNQFNVAAGRISIRPHHLSASFGELSLTVHLH